MTATQARAAIDHDFDSVRRLYGHEYAAGWRAGDSEWRERMSARSELFEMLGYLDDFYTGTGDPTDEYTKWLDAYAAEVREETLREAASAVFAVAAEMRECDGTYPDEWSSRECRDAVDTAGEKLIDMAEES